MKSKFFEYYDIIKEMREKGCEYDEIVNVLRSKGCVCTPNGISTFVSRHMPELEPGKKGDRARRCKTCIYRTKLIGVGESITACYYNVIMGHSRGCPGGDECTQYVKGTRRWNCNN